MTTHRAEHAQVINATPDVLYGLVADVGVWPAIFRPCVHVHRLSQGSRTERFRIWATVNGSVVDWTSRRELDPDRLRVEFAQEVSSPPVTAMSGSWVFRELAGGRTEVVLTHQFSVVDDAPGSVASVHAALDRNSAAELGALARVAQAGHPVDDLLFSFTDEVSLPGSAAAAYEFVARADLWAERLPHVSRVVVGSHGGGVQELEMDTVTPDGTSHRTQSLRVCSDGEWISYKQVQPPRLLLGHGGLWTFTQNGDLVVATATHTVVLDPAAVAELTGGTVAEARQSVREALGRNSLATLGHALAAATIA
ncbi:aromatase/cyclase [Actinokineospora sp. NBRC 105648]|uniref:aromatase/cyclase n=1 Tax=Actinokineospora sp. NBRC 105648 TaxID=3032206 RepID=UPI0024A09D47|nr:aromatase/cyclase [Actinokineospora sp. NBRC 105648]GLZ38903.1 actinorhodin polyketide synthase bifunctional cyclase/dehydratase [Actinokineospora sp. NBRC 105648]